MGTNDRLCVFARAVAEAVILLDAGTLHRFDDGTLRDLLTLVGADEAMPENLRNILATVVAELILRPAESMSSKVPTTRGLH